MFLREDFSRAQPEDTGVIEFPHRVMEGYREGLLSYIDTQAIREAKYKVVIDYAYGAAAGIFPSILGELGIEVVALNAFENPEKLTKSGDDFVAAQQRLSQMVQSIKADVGFLLDSGAERVFLVDEQGKIMDEDQALAAVCLLVMKSRTVKELAVPVTASRAIEEMAQKYQVRVKRSRIDNRSLIEEAAGENVAFVASRRGGYIFPEFQPAFDAMLSITKILELMALTGSKLGSITSEIPPSHMVKKNIPCPWSKKGLVLRTLMEQTKDHPEKQFIDGIKLFYGRDWVQVLPDPNRELFHINAEADDQNRAQELVNEYTRKIEECLK
jgi:mannose-1-phosphate guanylyltransferase/phosphomannomutase